MLDESASQIRMLIAPAGYGKTTLAREWLGEPERRDVWYRGGPATADVAALAAGLAEAVSGIVPDAGKRMRERIRATGHPEEDVDILAELFAEDVQEWPEDGWLAIDDYQFAMESAASERFVDLLTQLTPIQMLITSRRRPSWATARRILYDEIFEIDRRALAMEDAEARAVLRRTDESADELIVRAQGWPAVLGLASVANPEVVPEDLPTALYDYFAEELYQGLSGSHQMGLARLAVLSGVSSDLVRRVLDDGADEILRVAAAVGAIARAGPEVELHPLLQDFLLTKFEAASGDDDEAFAERATTLLLANRKWDETFTVIVRVQAVTFLPDLIAGALDDLLREGRAQTVSYWLGYAHANHLSSPALDLAEAEIAFREGQHARAERLALQAAKELEDGRLTSSALIRAGQAAMLDSRDAQALDSFRQARRVADDAARQHEALVGECLALLELGLADEAPEPFVQLERAAPSSPEHVVRQAMVQLVRAVKLGGIEPATRLATEVTPLLPDVTDPLIETAYLTTHVHLLILGARYEEAIDLGGAVLEVADRYRLKFVRPHALLASAIAHTGLREFAVATQNVDQAEREAGRHDVHIAMYAAVCRARVAISRGGFDSALQSLDRGWDRPGSEAMRAEQAAYRALAAALLGDSAACASAAAQARALAGATVEALILVDGAESASCLGKQGEIDRIGRLLGLVKETGVVDPLVTIFRGSPSMLGAARALADPHWLEDLLNRSNDFKLARSAGIELARPLSRNASTLTPREREVARLLVRGYRNREIAVELFISESTTKVHVRHIREKVGGSSRTELAARLAEFAD
jgi:ATP/maltotriose-dependent transcriptional regulator MalT